MSKEAADALEKAMEAQRRAMANATSVDLTLNLNQAIAIKVVGAQFLAAYVGDDGDDLSNYIKEAIAILQHAIDNC